MKLEDRTDIYQFIRNNFMDYEMLSGDREGSDWPKNVYLLNGKPELFKELIEKNESIMRCYEMKCDLWLKY